MTTQTSRTFTVTVTVFAQDYARAQLVQDEIRSNLDSLEPPLSFFVGSVMETTEPKETHEQTP